MISNLKLALPVATNREGDWLDVQLYFTGGDVSKAQTTLALTEALEVGPPPIGATPRNTRVQLQQFGDWHLAFASLLSLGGGLAGGILAYAWAAHRWAKLHAEVSGAQPHVWCHRTLKAAI